MTVSLRAHVVGVGIALGAAAVGPSSTAHAALFTFTGSTPNWHNPLNWDQGSVPGPGDDVVIAGGRSVIIDPTAGPASVAIRDLSVLGSSTLETLAGVTFVARNELIDNSALIHRSTQAPLHPEGGVLNCPPPPVGGGFGAGGLYLNPTPKSRRDVILKTSVTFGLGGTLPASNLVAGAFGAGHYATLTTDTADLGGALHVDFLYAFTPSAGQTFRIIDVGSMRIGEFDGLPEGALLAATSTIGFAISYAGGDGNDVTLTAVTIPAAGTASVLLAIGVPALRRRR